MKTMITQKPNLRAAAQAVVDRWETPLWKDAPATAGYIAALRDALAADHLRAVTELMGHWYMVNKDGMATLCANRKDAQRNADDAENKWPKQGPHRAVQLVPADDVAALKGQRMVLCSLLGECLPVIDALLQVPGDDESDDRLNTLAGRINAARAGVAGGVA